ncbi:hypothetical protein HAX54_043868, partial [Datura stramonium]|nr:hypothetical protein [Datura stramonium]
ESDVFDGDRPWLVGSITGWSVRDGEIFWDIQASPSGWCYVAHELRESHGGPICDFSIGGDRLFAFHRDRDIFDAWETPRPPIYESRLLKLVDEKTIA